MKVVFTNDFSKQMNSLRNNTLRMRVANVVQCVIQASTLYDIPNIKKLKGHHTAYRIRVGAYRIGIFFESNEIFFTLVEHRSRFYDIFP